MRGHKTYGRLDSQPSVSIKADWGQGVNTVLPGDRLPPMQFSGGLNISLREGYPLTRPGVAKAKWLYSQTASLGDVFQGGGLIQSADPDPVTKLPTSCLVVVDNDLWICCPNTEPFILRADITDNLQPVEFIDAFDEALILRGTAQTPLRYRFEAGHLPIELPTARSGQTVLPNAETGCYAGNRVWLKVGKNEVVASDIFEWDYNSTETRWQIDDGENDEIVRLWPVGEDRIVVFKTRSIHLIEGVASLDTATDPVIQITVRRVAAARGCVAKWGIAQRGQTLYYLGRDGLEALVLSDNAVNAMSDKPLSIAAQHYWNTLRWLSIEGSQMAIADQYLMISVPTRWREDENIPDLLLGGGFDVEDLDIEPGVAEMAMTAYDPTIELYEAVSPVNYIEFPYFQLDRFRESTIQFYDTTFRGTVRLWESGTVEYEGEARTNAPLGRDLRIWIGTGPIDGGGHYETVATLPSDNSWTAVNFSFRMDADEFAHVLIGDADVAGTHNKVGLWSYAAGGWIYPQAFAVPGDPNLTVSNMDRVGTTIEVDASWGNWVAAQNLTGCYSYELDSSTWISANFSQTNPTGQAPAAGSGSYALVRTIPDSATTGLRFHQLTSQAGGYYYGVADFGPLLRSTYDPVIQQGFDPEA